MRSNSGAGLPTAQYTRLSVGIEAAGQPRRTAAGFPALSFPRVVAELARPGNRVEAPAALAGGGIVRVEMPSRRVLAAGHPGDDHVLQHERRARDARAFHRVDDLLLPQRLTGPRVDGDEPSVERADEDAIAEDGDAARKRIDLVRVHDFLLAGPAPDLPARSRVDRGHRRRIAAAGRVHHAVDDDRRGFQTSSCRRESGSSTPSSTDARCSALICVERRVVRALSSCPSTSASCAARLSR